MNLPASPRVLSAAAAVAVTLGGVRPAFAQATSAKASRQAYVVQPESVHAINETDLPRLRVHPCKPRFGAAWYRPPRGVAEHCHGRLFVAAQSTRLSGDRGFADGRGALLGGFSLWGWTPSLSFLTEAELGGGEGLTGAFTFKELGGPRLPHGVTLQVGTSIVTRGAPESGHGRWELPRVELGWAHYESVLLVAAGAHGGWLPVGSFRVGDHRDSLDGAVPWGVHGVFSARGPHTRTVVLADLSRFERHRPVHELDLRLCSGTGRVLLCTRLEHRWRALDAEPGSAFDADKLATIGTFSVGLGAP